MRCDGTVWGYTYTVCNHCVHITHSHCLYSGSLGVVGSGGVRGGGDRVSNGSPATRPLCLQRPPHIVLIVLEENPTSSTSHCCSVQTANKRGPEGQRSWQTRLTIPCSKTNIVPSSQHLNNRKSQTSALGLFLQRKKTPSVRQNKSAGRQC